MTRSEVEAMIAPLREALAQRDTALEEAKATIRALLRHLHGTRSERSALVLTAEGQRLIDAQWLQAQQEKVPDAPAQDQSQEAPKRPARDGRGVAQRHPHLRIDASEAPVPEELREAVESGAVHVERTGAYEDSLVVPREKPFIRRVYEVALINVRTAAPALTVPMPPRIVAGGVLADESIHQLIIAKFLDAIPFHRTLAAWARERVDIARQVVNDAFAAWSGIFAPLSEAIIDQVLHSAVVHADESWARLQDAKACQRVNIWTLVGGGQVGYRYTPDRTHARAAEVIGSGFTGYLVRDAWPGWKTLGDIAQAGCNAHARRPFAAFLKSDPANPDAALMVELYAQVYRLEHAADDGPPDGLLERRRRIRAEQTTVVMDRIEAEAKRIAATYPSRHALAEGARYIGNHAADLRRFLADPLLPPDNNAAEGALRINALIRKNSMFFGSDGGGERAAIALTVLHSCRLAGIEPLGYLQRVTPALILHAKGRKQDLAALTPLAVAHGGQGMPAT
jgi:transposase